MLGLSAIGLFISTLTLIPVGAMAATLVVSTVTQILGALAYSRFTTKDVLS